MHMIVSFADKETEELWLGNCPPKWRKIERAARRKLDMLAAATRPQSLRVPSGNDLKKVIVAGEEFLGIRINLQWAVYFKWTGDGPANVHIGDHLK